MAADSISGDSAVVGIRVGVAPSFASSARKANNGPSRQTTSTAKGQLPGKVPAHITKSAAAQGRGSVSSSNNFVDNGEWGVGYVTIIQKYSLRILDHAPWSIWPTLLPGGVTAGPGYRDEAATLKGYRPERSFTILVTDGQGNPVKNVAVEITQTFQRGSGGHAHTASGDVVPPPSLQGVFYGQEGHGSSLQLTTGQNGMATVDKYVASQVSGTYLITASLVSDPSVRDTVNLNVQVPGLVNFRDLVFLPNDQKPYTFTQSPDGDENHPANDYCTPAMGDSLFLGILDFYGWSASQNEGGVGMVISLNDMSLPWGGLFDAVNADWKPPHMLHRIGRSVDINNGGVFQTADARDPKRPIVTNAGIWLQYWMNQHHGYRIPEGESVHYEFYQAH